MSDKILLVMIVCCAGILAWHAKKRGKNPWIWGTVGAFGHIVAIVAWFGYYYGRPIDGSTKVAINGEIVAAPVTTDADNKPKSDLDGHSAPVAVDNPGFHLGPPFRGLYDDAVVGGMPDACINCGNWATCFDSFSQLRLYGQSRCDEYQRDDALDMCPGEEL